MVDILTSFYLLADGFLIFFYRITGMPLVDYFMGTFFLAFLCVVVGEISVSLALRFNQRYIDEMTTEMETKEKLSMEAYRSGDRTSYRALNKEATDVWGKRFFTMVVIPLEFYGRYLVRWAGCRRVLRMCNLPWPFRCPWFLERLSAIYLCLSSSISFVGFFSNTSVLSSHTLKVFKTRWTGMARSGPPRCHSTQILSPTQMAAQAF